MRLRHVLAALAGHWRRQRLQLATLVIGLAVATALWSGVQALNAEARASYARAGAVLGGADVATIRAGDGGLFPVAHYVALRRAGWPVSPILEGDLILGAASYRIVGVDPLAGAAPTEALEVGGGPEDYVSFVRRPWRALAAPETITELAAIRDGPDLPPLEPSATLPPGTLLMDIGAAGHYLGIEAKLSRLLLPASEAGRTLPPDLAERLRLLPPSTENDLSRLTGSFHLNLTAFGLLSFVVGLFIVYSAIGLAFEQRKPLIRTLRICGVSARALTASLLLELVAIALVAGLLGTAAGYFIAAALLPDVAASLRGLYGAQVSGSLGLAPSWWLSGVAISVLGALAASAASLARAWGLPPIASGRPEAWLDATRRAHRLQGAAAAATAAVTVALLLAGGGLIAGFAAMGGLLLAAALALPVLLGALLTRLGRSARRPLTEWAWADSRQELSGLSFALMALLLALAVNLGVGTMVRSFRETFTTYLDQRLAQEIYIVAGSDAQAARITEWLEARPEVTAILPYWRGETRIGALPVEVNGHDAHETYRRNWPLIEAGPAPWDALAEGRGVLVSEQLARSIGLAPGDQLAIPTPSGDWRTQVAGIYPDYGNPEGQILAARTEVGARWPEADKRRVGGRAAPGDVAAILADLRAAFGLAPEQAYDQASVKALSLRIFDRTFAVTAALNLLTLIVAGIALLASLLTLANARLARLAPLWAMGLPQRSLALAETAKTVGLALFTALAALPLGQAVAWVLTAVINVEAFGWRLPVGLYPDLWASLVGLALATAALAALVPAWRLARARPADLMRRFSNER